MVMFPSATPAAGTKGHSRNFFATVRRSKARSPKCCSRAESSRKSNRSRICRKAVHFRLPRRGTRFLSMPPQPLQQRPQKLQQQQLLLLLLLLHHHHHEYSPPITAALPRRDDSPSRQHKKRSCRRGTRRLTMSEIAPFKSSSTWAWSNSMTTGSRRRLKAVATLM